MSGGPEPCSPPVCPYTVLLAVGPRWVCRRRVRATTLSLYPAWLSHSRPGVLCGGTVSGAESCLYPVGANASERPHVQARTDAS